MKLVFGILFSVLLLIDPTAISKINTAKADAKKAFNDGKYKEAIQKYRYLIDKLGINEDEIKMNLAHAYYLENDTTNAKPLYQELTQSAKNQIRSNAFQQLGVMTNKQGKSEEALSLFKQAIKADATNEDARYNYEMLKKKLEEQKKNQQKKDQNNDQQNKDDKKDQKDNKDQQKKDQQNKDQKDQQKKEQEKREQDKKEQEKKEQEKKEQEKKEQEQQKKDEQKKDQKDQQDQEQKDEEQKKNEKVPKQVSQKLKEMNMSEEKARMILEAMKNQEVQYLQQNRRKATKPKDKGKPDW